MWKNKRGMELTVNFIVILILSLAILGSSIVLTKKFFSKTSAYTSSVDAQQKEQIKKLMFSGEKVVIPFNNVEIKRGKFGNVGVGVYNVDSDNSRDKFLIGVTYREKAYNKDGSALTGQAPVKRDMNDDVIKTAGITGFSGNIGQLIEIEIKNNEQQIVIVGFDLSGDIVKAQGKYAFDVEVWKCQKTAPGSPNWESDSACVGRDYYGGRKHKVYVTVP